ncbi:unnamed protein product [Urochloa humidicola]
MNGHLHLIPLLPSPSPPLSPTAPFPPPLPFPPPPPPPPTQQGFPLRAVADPRAAHAVAVKSGVLCPSSSSPSSLADPPRRELRGSGPRCTRSPPSLVSASPAARRGRGGARLARPQARGRGAEARSRRHGTEAKLDVEARVERSAELPATSPCLFHRRSRRPRPRRSSHAGVASRKGFEGSGELLLFRRQPSLLRRTSLRRGASSFLRRVRLLFGALGGWGKRAGWRAPRQRGVYQGTSAHSGNSDPRSTR